MGVRLKSTPFEVSYRNGQLWGPLHERPIIDRVVSTSSWPVPYYQRLFKAYPIRGTRVRHFISSLEDKEKVALTWAGCEINDCNWYWAKKILNRTFKGRQAVTYVENNLELQSKIMYSNTHSTGYILIQKDVGRMAKAYVNDISLFLDCANKESKVILDSADLI